MLKRFFYFILHRITNFILLPFPNARGRMKGRLQWRYKHFGAKKFLQKKYIYPFLKGDLEHFNFKPLKKFKDDKIIWQFWAQGLENAPKIAQKSVKSMHKFMCDYEIILLDMSNLHEFIALPSFVLEKVQNKTINFTFFSDILRCALLSTYGGIWADATIILTDKIPHFMLEKPFFAMQKSENPPKDAKIWTNFNSGYFVWKDEFSVKLFSAFLVAKPKYPLLLALQDILLNYIKNEQKLISYFTLHLIFELLMQSEYAKFNCTITNDTDVHLLQLHQNEPYYDDLWREIKAKTKLHKLDKNAKIKPNSMLEHALSEV